MLHHGLYEQVINNALNSELAEIPEARKAVAPIDKAEASKVLAQYLADVVQKGLDNVVDNGGDMVEVVAALIWDENKFMICQRPEGKARGLLWEFVGGKVESGESKEQALIRECREELAVTLSVGEVFMDVVHAYPDITVHLTLFHATIAEGVPQKLEHNDIRWITPGQIPEYDFCPADEEILRKITEVYYGQRAGT